MSDVRGDGLRWLRLKDENAERKDVEIRTRMQNQYSWRYYRAVSKWSKWVVEKDVGLLRSRRKMCIRKPVSSPIPLLTHLFKATAPYSILRLSSSPLHLNKRRPEHEVPQPYFHSPISYCYQCSCCTGASTSSGTSTTDINNTTSGSLRRPLLYRLP